jgi:hypothetical protein
MDVVAPASGMYQNTVTSRPASSRRACDIEDWKARSSSCPDQPDASNRLIISNDDGLKIKHGKNKLIDPYWLDFFS